MEGFSAERDKVKTAGQIVVGKSFIFFEEDRIDLLVVSIYILLIIKNKKKSK